MTEHDVGPDRLSGPGVPDGRAEGRGSGQPGRPGRPGDHPDPRSSVREREKDGSFTAAAITDLDGDGTLDLAVFEGVESGLLDDDDLSEAVSLIEPGNGVALIVYENTWAGPFVSAMRQVGAEVIASGRIPADDVVAALDALESADA